MIRPVGLGKDIPRDVLEDLLILSGLFKKGFDQFWVIRPVGLGKDIQRDEDPLILSSLFDKG